MSSASCATLKFSKLDSSRSKIYLTPHNYHGPRLLSIIKDRVIFLNASNTVRSEGKNTNMRPKQEAEEDINALPLSSEDEELPQIIQKKETTARGSSVKRGVDQPQPMRTSKRRKLQDEPQLDTRNDSGHNAASTLSSTASNAAGFDLFSSGSQSQSMKSKRKGYKNRANGFQTFDEVVPHGPRETIISDLPSSPNAPRTDRSKDVRPADLNIEEPLLTNVAARESHPIINFGSDDESSAASSDQKLTNFELPESPKAFHSQRSGSASSQTSASVNGIHVKEADQSNNEKQGFEKSSDEPLVTTISCPICHTTIPETTPINIPPDLSKLSFQQQRDFCYKHRLHDATLLWSARNYPTIDWHDLESVRIPNHIQHLKSVLSRNVRSHYLTILDSRISESKGRNRKALRTYLLQGIIDVAKTGYYGPKGHKIMLQTVTQTLSKDLSRAVQRDEAVKMAGVGPFVTTVLVPELTVRLVMEDLGIRDEEKGRKVLEESNEVGLLLNADDDLVEGDNDDEVVEEY